MNKYQVAIYKPVADLTVAYVEIEAESEEAALVAVLDVDVSDLDFRWLCCSDTLESIDYEVKGIINPPV